MTLYPMFKRGTLEILSLCLLIAVGCTRGEAERATCVTDQDCVDQSLPSGLSCLPVVAGETLNEFCRTDSRFCPFHRHAPTMYAMPKICDVDRNADGVADVYALDQYQPVYHANGSIDDGDLVIAGLFRASCGSNPGMVSGMTDLPFESMCVPEGTIVAQPVDAPCLADIQCQSGRCAADIGMEGVCIDGAGESRCASDEDCLGGLCISQLCSDGSGGAGCRRNSDCQDGIPCINEICSDGTAGQTCHFDEDCRDALICAEAVCTSGTDGAACVDNNQCIALVDCVDGACRPESSQAAQGACAQARSLGVLTHDLETEVSFDGIRPDRGGPSCGAEARGLNLQRAMLFELPGPARLDVSYSAPGAARLFIREHCTVPSSLVLCEQVNNNSADFSKRISLAAGTYSIHISSPDSAASVDHLRLKAVYDDPADGGGESHGVRLSPGTCQTPTPITFGIYSGTTSDAPRLHEGTCATAGGPETVLVYEAQEDGQVCVSTAGSSYDTVTYVRGGRCQEGAELACNDDSAGQQAEVAFDAFFGTTYFIFVDAFGTGAGGEYHVSVTRGPCP